MKNKLNIGDLLYRSKLLVEHAGIYLGKGKVLHNSPSGNVEICALEEYANGKPVKVVLSHLSEDKKNELLNQAEQLIKKARKYGVLNNNCEHLASTVLHDKPSSEQLQGASLGAVAGLLLAHCNQSKNSLLYMLAGGLIGCMAVNAVRKYDCVV
ncbi:NC domain [Vibrio cincinnatiensis]|uniref:Lecithin retinol acyltransferase n=1 Tax=Vibrio cincinnatiensis DSM 19608 TaxID=1123491 RepID=A0A1T4SBL3_VIBCI|nr:lecithin retinol acyltransferase family protein [Vibrio cincinnatiensis]SKA25634.1 Lecithin retinol acyltransferase [Vibrio cincinnatiensis DSM 19608]SUP49068.1 NC domain [Vibrio cincinnatiensis]